jgi:hypothetical protein
MERKLIVLVLYRECEMAKDLKILPYVSFLLPKVYEEA